MDAIRTSGLGKRYRMGVHQRYGSLRDSVAQFVKSPLRVLRRQRDELSRAVIWALKDVSVSVRHGEVLGIVGRNGSGKSTFLKVLSRITEPTVGWAQIRGRVGSLLEVGTGFHPELTGRENVFVNGAILGMTRRDVSRRFDEIVAFSGVEEFIDTPVKHYSSGMQMRLAFAVAAHLEPEILLIDEVLAVGDAAFQKKCLGKMEQVHSQGRTVVLVSHQMNQLRRLCTTALWLERGQVAGIGPAKQIVAAYEATFREPSGDVSRSIDAKDRARFVGWRFLDTLPSEDHTLSTHGAMAVSFRLKVQKPLGRVKHGVACLSAAGQNLWGNAVVDLHLEPGEYEFVHHLPTLPLQPGPYYWQVSVYDDTGMIDLWDCVPEASVATDPVTHYRDEYAGILNIPSRFECVRRASSESDSRGLDSAFVRA